MKKLLLLIQFSILGFVSSAQIQITQSDVSNFFAVGKSWQRFGTENPTAQMNVGTSGGTAQNWAVPAFTYEYYQITSNGLYSLGRVVHYQTSQFDTTIITMDQELILQLPLTYGTTFAVTRDSTDLGGGSYIINTSSQTVDASGTIAFPWNSYGTLRVKASSGTELYFGGTLFSQSSETYFNWITKDGGIFEATPDTNSGISGTVNLTDASLIQIIKATSAENENALPYDFVLYQNYPNPFNPTTIIKYSIPFNTNVSIRVYDILGNEIAALVNENKNAGNYEVVFSADNLSSGIYFYKLITGNKVQTKKMILLR